MHLDNLGLTSEDFWRAALITALMDAVFIAILIRLINGAHFCRLKWPLAGAGAIFWSVFGVALYQGFWETYYRYFASSWLRAGGVLLITVPMGVILALLFYALALRLPGNPIISFCLLGGLESLLEHLWGFYGFKIMEIPLLQGVSPASILAFAFPEYMFYWCIVIGLAALINRGRVAITQRRFSQG